MAFNDWLINSMMVSGNMDGKIIEESKIILNLNMFLGYFEMDYYFKNS